MNISRYLLAFLALTLFAGLAVSQTGEDVETPRADVVLERQGDELAAVWTLSEPVESVSFQGWVEADERIRLWVPQGDDWQFDGVVLARVGGSAFDSFELRMKPSDQFYDRRYVPVLRIGEAGWTVLSEGLSLSGYETFMAASRMADGEVFLAANERRASGESVAAATGGFVYIGPEDHVTDDHATVIAGPDIPGWLRGKFVADIDAISETLTDRFTEPPPAPPVLIMTYREGDGASFKGSSLGRFITLHVRGFDLDPSDDDFMGRMKSLALHETVHVWVGQLYSSSENAEQSWVHEGAAEYISMRAGMDEAHLRADIEEKINQCQRALVRRPLTTTRYGSRGRAPYDCGALVQLIAEAASLQHGGGDILTIWKDVFARAGEDRTFDSATFKAAASEAGGEAFARRMDMFAQGMNAEEWSAFLIGLSEIGVEVELLAPTAPHPDDFQLAGTALGALQRDVCQNQVSLYQREDHYWTDISEHCGGQLPGNPQLRQLNGIDLVDAPGAAYAEMRRACSAGEAIVLGQLNGEELAPISCGEWMTNLPALAVVRALPELPPL
ncbi:hypothetical protein [Henriciella algicola]|uniref:Peptidase M61 catalytic domain-containing protein n=1 Tax=Henriciella algicola TaxID=1608422 RepID=A0A399R9N9_9PROT|nr:hypothetical protein [Henriciella algicola]RIJ27503.1 hypothetical protein D1222_13990 [Henriciella algicola]